MHSVCQSCVILFQNVAPKFRIPKQQKKDRFFHLNLYPKSDLPLRVGANLRATESGSRKMEIGPQRRDHNERLAPATFFSTWHVLSVSEK